MSKFDPENIILDKDEQWIEDHLEEFVPMENQDKLRKQLIKAAKKNIELRNKKKKAKKTKKLPVFFILFE